MIAIIVKRDGRIEKYDQHKVAEAIRKAMTSTGNVDNELVDKIVEKISTKGSEQSTVLEIQDAIEKELMNSRRKDVAKAFISYRDRRDVARKAKSSDVFMSIINATSNDVTRENANMNADTPAGMMMKFASETTKVFVDDYLLSPLVKNAVMNNYIHIHDKDYYPTKSLTCVQHPLDRVLTEGFSAGHGESRPAKRIETASILGCISLETAQNEMHGGQAIPAFDFYLAPYVRLTFKEELKEIGTLYGIDITKYNDIELSDYTKCDIEDIVKYLNSINNVTMNESGSLMDTTDYIKDIVSRYGEDAHFIQHAINRTINRVHQSIEAFIHNMNTIHSRGGNQVVFSSINYGTDTSAEGRCIIRELLNCTYEGVGNGSTAIFPIQIWKKKRGVNYLPEDRNYDLYKMACKVTARRFFPNYLNLDATFNQDPDWDENDPKRYEHEVATMGCRTRVFENRFGKRTSIGRGNISFTSINIVKLAIEVMNIENYDERIEAFFNALDSTMEIAAVQLNERYDFQKTALAKQFPLLMNKLWIEGEKLHPMDTIESVINQGTLSIGFIGLAECLKALTGKHHGESEESQKLGIKIISHMRDKCNEFSEVYKHNYGLLGTPAESLSGKFVKKDKQEFGIIEGVTDRDYYTNSSHVPVYYKCTATHKAEVEAPYHDFERAGHIFYVELDGDATHNPDSVSGVVDLMDKYNMGYGSINHNRNRCMNCGYENADKKIERCPKCGSTNIDRLQRITGYLVGTTDRWNHAKLSELNDRVTHN